MKRLSDAAMTVLQERYLRRNDQGEIMETPEDMFRRVAQTVAEADKLFGNNPRRSTERFFEVMSNLEFLPNSPTLMNAGRPLGQLSACFVLPIRDSLRGIFETLKHAALVHKSGGGTGFSFSRLRPKGDFVGTTGGTASGPLSFMTVYNMATDVVKQGAVRSGANMGTLRIDHPDIEEFITAKQQGGVLTNFNLSVAITDDFMEAVRKDDWFALINPRDGRIVKTLQARVLFHKLAEAAWKSGEPGVIFIDRMNSANPTPELGRFETTNPCGEVPLLSYESCNLGSINLANMTKQQGDRTVMDWDKLSRTIHTAVHFLDNVIECNKFTMARILLRTKATRKIGLGVMGFADLLIDLHIPYNSEQAVEMAEQLMSFIAGKARETSAELAEERGAFPQFHRSIYHYPGSKLLRNATVTTIAPTGTLSIIAGCSSGIEPLFALAFTRHVLGDAHLPEVNQRLVAAAKHYGFYNQATLAEIAHSGSVQQVQVVPPEVRKVFVTAHDIEPLYHIKIQAAFQKYTDNAVSKTINFANHATVEDIEQAFMTAYSMGCKGLTVFRDKCLERQVLTVGAATKENCIFGPSCAEC